MLNGKCVHSIDMEMRVCGRTKAKITCSGPRHSPDHRTPDFPVVSLFDGALLFYTTELEILLSLPDIVYFKAFR
jgi:hypothetical protein